MSEELNEAKEIVESRPEKKKVSIFRSSLFNKTYATNVMVTSTDVDFRLELFNEKFKIDDGWASLRWLVDLNEGSC